MVTQPLQRKFQSITEVAAWCENMAKYEREAATHAHGSKAQLRIERATVWENVGRALRQIKLEDEP
jgi:hypothetical protein